MLRSRPGLWRRSWRRREKWWIGEPAAINAMHIYFYLKAPWDGAFGGWGGPRVRVTTVLIFHFAQAPAFDGRGNETSNDCDMWAEVREIICRSSERSGSGNGGAGLNCRRIAPLTHQRCWVRVPSGLKVKCTSWLHSRAVVWFSFFPFLYEIYSTFLPR